MIKGLYTAVSAMVANVRRQSLKAHNVANLTTPGFKQIYTTLQEFHQTEIIPMKINDQRGTLHPIGILGLGVMTTEIRKDFSGGALQVTKQPLDFAIQGDGFFRIMTASGERYTRDGRFIRDADGRLITLDGNWVLDISGGPILLPSDELTVDSKGNILSQGTLIAQLGIAEFTRSETQLKEDSENLFKALEAPIQAASNSTIHQGYLEMSNVNIVDMMMSAKTYEAAQKVVQLQDELLGKSIGMLGKLA